MRYKMDEYEYKSMMTDFWMKVKPEEYYG